MENLDDNNLTNYELATPGDRFLAALIDGLIGMVMGLVPILGVFVNLAYVFTKDALPFLDGQSIGKKAMKIRVLDAETGEPITNKFDKAAIRQVSMIIPIFNIVDAFMVLNEERKRFGDKWANTIVVKWTE